MRNVTNISLPIKLRKEVEQAVKTGRYASINEFFRDAIRAWKENELYKSVMQSEKEFAAGKFKKLRSLRDLM